MLSIYNAIQLQKYKKSMKQLEDISQDNQETVVKMTNVTKEFMERYFWANKAEIITKILILIIALCIDNSSAADMFATIMLYILFADCLFNYCVSIKRVNIVGYYRNLIYRENGKEKEKEKV